MKSEDSTPFYPMWWIFFICIPFDQDLCSNRQFEDIYFKKKKIFKSYFLMIQSTSLHLFSSDVNRCFLTVCGSIGMPLMLRSWSWLFLKRMIYIRSDWNDSQWRSVKHIDSLYTPYICYNASNLHFERQIKVNFQCDPSCCAPPLLICSHCLFFFNERHVDVIVF